jgi:hypothetical protein
MDGRVLRAASAGPRSVPGISQRHTRATWTVHPRKTGVRAVVKVCRAIAATTHPWQVVPASVIGSPQVRSTSV